MHGCKEEMSYLIVGVNRRPTSHSLLIGILPPIPALFPLAEKPNPGLGRPPS